MTKTNQKILHHISGHWSEPAAGRFFEDLSPEDDSLYAMVARGDADDADRAVRAAYEAFERYSRTTPLERETWLANAAALLQERREEIIETIIAEGGSPRFKAEIEVKIATQILRASAGIPRQVCGQTLPSDYVDRLSMSVRQPLGVVLHITPFNVPLILGARAAFSLACGNTVVLLPSEEAPCVGAFYARLFQDAGFPPGALNVVMGLGHEVGDHLTSHPLVRAVNFTGSTRVGSHIANICGAHRKRVVLEMGGKNPLVIMADADLEKAVHAALHSSFAFQGQACMASSRIYVQQAVFDKFLSLFAAGAKRLGMGELRDPSTIVGPIISARQRDRVRQHIDDAKAKGAAIVCGGGWRGNRCEPTILTNVTEDMVVCRTETFGPVTSVYSFESFDEAVMRANDSKYGLSAAIFTSNLQHALEFAKRVQSGMVHVNAPTLGDEPHAPFGGFGDSGFDRESTQSAINGETEWKWVTVQL